MRTFGERRRRRRWRSGALFKADRRVRIGVAWRSPLRSRTEGSGTVDASPTAPQDAERQPRSGVAAAGLARRRLAGGARAEARGAGRLDPVVAAQGHLTVAFPANAALDQVFREDWKDNWTRARRRRVRVATVSRCARGAYLDTTRCRIARSSASTSIRKVGLVGGRERARGGLAGRRSARLDRSRAPVRSPTTTPPRHRFRPIATRRPANTRARWSRSSSVWPTASRLPGRAAGYHSDWGVVRTIGLSHARARGMRRRISRARTSSSTSRGGMPIEVSPGATPGAAELPSNIHFTFYAFQIDPTGGPAVRGPGLRDPPGRRSGSPCFIDVGDHVQHPGLHVSQYEKVIDAGRRHPRLHEPAGRPRPRAEGDGSDRAPAAWTTSTRCSARRCRLFVVTSASTAEYYPAMVAPTAPTRRRSRRRRAPTRPRTSAGSTLCQKFWNDNPGFYEGTDRVLTAPLAGTMHGMVDGRTRSTSRRVGGAQFFVDEALAGFDGYACTGSTTTPTATACRTTRRAPAARSEAGSCCCSASPTMPTRGVMHVHMTSPPSLQSRPSSRSSRTSTRTRPTSRRPMRFAIILFVVAAAASGCKSVDCGPGTIERNGTCDPAIRAPGTASCGVGHGARRRSVRADAADAVRSGRRPCQMPDPNDPEHDDLRRHRRPGGCSGRWRARPRHRQADDLRPALRHHGQLEVRRAGADRREVRRAPTTTGRAR